MRTPVFHRIALALAVTACVCASHGLAAQPLQKLDYHNEGVEVKERLNARIPDTSHFKNSDGQPVVMGDYFNKGRPVLLTFNYSNCPRQCSVQLTNLASALGASKMLPGKDFDIVTILIDHREPVSAAKALKDRYVGESKRPEIAAGWHVLVGDEKNIREITNACGYQFRYDAAESEFYHQTALVGLAPEGRVVGYLMMSFYKPGEIETLVTKAALGEKAGMIVDADRTVFDCGTDNMAGNSAKAIRFMSLGGAVVLMFAAGLAVFLFRTERNRTKLGLNDRTGAPGNPAATS